MNYKLIYENLIEKRKINIFEGYGEKHHIIPRCMDGNDNPENIVRLTAREHFFAHLLLIKIYPKHKGLLSAIWYMSNCSRYTSKQYSWMREQYYSHGSYHKGKTYEEIMGIEKAMELKKIRSKSLSRANSIGITGGSGDNNPMSKKRSGRSDEFFRNKSLKAYESRRKNGNNKHSQETKRKIGNSCKNVNKKIVYLYDSSGTLIVILDSLNSASLYLNKSVSYLSTWIKNKPNELFAGNYYIGYHKR